MQTAHSNKPTYIGHVDRVTVSHLTGPGIEPQNGIEPTAMSVTTTPTYFSRVNQRLL